MNPKAVLEELGWQDGSRMKVYGTKGPRVIELHGGPGATGAGAPIARELSDEFRTFSPWQRRSGDTPLTVARHIADLHSLIRSTCEDVLPALVGESWGAMLALAYAAAHPQEVGPLVLVGCGTFDKASRARMGEVIKQRTTDEIRTRLKQMEAHVSDPAERMVKRNEITRRIYDYDPIDMPANDPPEELFDMKGHTETWADMIRCQERGLYPESFAVITTPVIILHGTYDPHPGRMTRDTLLSYIPHLEYHEWEKCGHSPWVEKHARGAFFALLRQWLKHNAEKTECPTTFSCD